MAYINNIFEKNFIEYASYVIRDRAIPDLGDGLKPVQRRILHSLFEIDHGEGKFHKVANIVGHCMKYHPHGDASIGDALVVLANKEYFIDRQGNFGNILTGDPASAPRYIECRATPLSKDIFLNPKLTTYIDSYDGRSKEPLLYPAKIPVILVIGAEGIAVGMSTKILPHNIIEVLEAQKLCLKGKPFELFPDFPCGAYVDVSEYKDGNGKVMVRAKLDTSDPKRIVIRELPFGSTTESMMSSIETAAKAGRVKIQSINDYTGENVEIEIKLARGVYAQETIDALFAFTECEASISVNFLVIQDNFPVVTNIQDVIKHHCKQLVTILTNELELEKKELQDKYHLRNLERIFIEERIYKLIEKEKTAEGVNKAILKGFNPLIKEVGNRGITDDDIEHLLKIPIRRISLYDINKAKDEMDQIKLRIKAINSHLKNITEYTLAYIDSLITKIKANEELCGGKRKTKVGKFEKIDLKEVSGQDVGLYYDSEKGYLGTSVTGTLLGHASQFERVLVVRKDGVWIVQDISDKVFVGERAWFVGVADKEKISSLVFTIIYKDKKTNLSYIKRCTIEAWIMNKEYPFVPPDCEVLWVDTRNKFSFTLCYIPRPKIRVLKEEFKAEQYLVKGIKANGVRLSVKEVKKIECKKDK
ncbi:DNA topoisomerase IV subunit A [Spirochaetia bacterium]|nr:DNA topoisomerase IV subunit A [Spirochaetia bacterium]